MKTSFKVLPVLVLLLTPPAVVQAQFTFTTNNGTISIIYPSCLSGAVTIPDWTNGLPVVSIGASAFERCSSLTSVTMGTNVTSIGQDAFNGCTALTSVVIASGVISPWAFELCGGLTNVIIGSGVTSIGSNAFSSCVSLTTITVDTLNPVYSSLDGVLFDLSQRRLLQYPGGKGGDYTIPSSVTSIAASAFNYCTNLTSIAIPNSVTNIGDSAFNACLSLRTIMIPDSISAVGYGVFEGCHSLTNVIIGRNVSRLVSLAFSWCDTLTSVAIPNSVTNIGPQAFSYCNSVTGYYFQGNAPSLGSSFLGSSPFGPSYGTAVVYYLPGTTGWGTNFGGLPTVLWNPTIQTTNADFGVQNNQFGFTITGTTNIPIAVVACTNPANPTWLPMQTCTLTNGSIYFSDPQWTNHPARLYRIRSP